MHFLLQKRKFENMKLSSQLLEAIGDESINKNDSKSTRDEGKFKKIDVAPKSIKLDDLNENDLSKSTFSDFIPLKTYS